MKKRKIKRCNKNDYGENFIAPDGGWGWAVAFAAGLSNLSIYPCLQQFGFLFRDRLTVLGLTTSEITTIINTNPAISACSGLLNGPMFRRFTYRQIAIAGSIFIFTGIFLTMFCQSFLTFMLAYAILYGFGMGISVSASSLAIFTYFKSKRRKASSWAWTITGVGPIIFPYCATYLLSFYGIEGTILIFAALSLHSLVSAVAYQPVHYHTKGLVLDSVCEKNNKCQFCQFKEKTGNDAMISNQYIFIDDDDKDDDVKNQEIVLLTDRSEGILPKLIETNSLEKNESTFEAISKENNTGNESLISHNMKQLYCQCEKNLTNLIPDKSEVTSDKNSNLNNLSMSKNCIADSKPNIIQRIIKFFDLDLLRDVTYVNLVIGLTIINFGELNFSILTPFILDDFGFDTSQITRLVSTLASLDITVRFLAPYLTEKIALENKYFFLIGVVGIAIGRTVVACTKSYSIIMMSFIWIGLNKGLRTIFWPLIIPSHVPLKKLAAASGLQLLISGLFTLIFGPFVGLIRDRYDYSVTLHCLNFLSFFAAFLWILEAIVRKYLFKTNKESNTN